MSDPAKPREIEDVLSSIRRLVADEAGPQMPPSGATGTGRLVLTPALRIDPPEMPRGEEPEAPDQAHAQGATDLSIIPDRESHADLEDRIADLESAVDRYDECWDPDDSDSGADPAQGWSLGSHESGASNASGAGADPDMSGETGQEDDSTLFDDPDETALLDEDMLRDLISDIVRQELQGALGERITRNVRKLVRREIARALAARDFD